MFTGIITRGGAAIRWAYEEFLGDFYICLKMLNEALRPRCHCFGVNPYMASFTFHDTCRQNYFCRSYCNDMSSTTHRFHYFCIKRHFLSFSLIKNKLGSSVNWIGSASRFCVESEARTSNDSLFRSYCFHLLPSLSMVSKANLGYNDPPTILSSHSNHVPE